MARSSPMSDELVELVARRMRVLGEPTRIRLLDHLRDGERSVTELAEALAAGQQNVSRHLCLLADAGILARRKDRNHVYYRIVDAGALDLCERVCGSLAEQLEVLTAVVGRGRQERERT